MSNIRRIKVALLGNFSVYPFERELGVPAGVVQRVTSWNETLSEALASLAGLEVRFFTRYRGSVTRTVRRGGLTVTYLAAPKLVTAATMYHCHAWKARRLLRDWGADLVHGIGTEHIWPWAALHCGRPNVITLHGLVQEVARRTGASALSLLSYFAWLERRVVRAARHVIAISPYVSDWLRGKSDAQAYLVENPVNDLFFRATASVADSRTILFVGNSGCNKGLGTLVEAFGRLRSQNRLAGWHIQICGPMKDDEYHLKTLGLMDRYRVTSDITFKGFVPPMDLATTLSEAAFLVLPSLQETAPMCIAESMSVGLPVVASNVGGVHHMVQQGSTGWLFPPGNTDGLMTALEMAARSPDQRVRFGLAARQVAAQRWEARAVAAQTLRVYRSVLGLQAAGGESQILPV